MAHDVFFSYSSKDKTVADAVVATLEKNNIRCWYAPRDIKPGEDWGKAITGAIKDSHILLLVFSASSDRSQRVLDEVNYAITCKNTILPFRIEDLEPSDALLLHLASRHWLNAYDPSWDKHLKQMVTIVASNLDIPIDADEMQLPKFAIHKKKIITAAVTGGTGCDGVWGHLSGSKPWMDCRKVKVFGHSRGANLYDYPGAQSHTSQG